MNQMQTEIKIFRRIIPAILIISFFGCSKEVNYSNIPEIQFKKYEIIKNMQNRDSALKLTITYTDGDGDLGLTQADTFPPFDTGSIFYNNLFAYYYEYIEGKWTQVTVNDFSTDTIRFNYRFPNLTPTSDNKAIKGEIEYTIAYLEPRKSSTIKFRIFINDRALNISDTVESPPIDFIP
jgi:hypothetical protein